MEGEKKQPNEHRQFGSQGAVVAVVVAVVVVESSNDVVRDR